MKYILTFILLLGLSLEVQAQCPCRNRCYRIWFPSIRGTHSVVVKKMDQPLLDIKSDLFFVVYQDGAGEYHWNLKAKNSKLIADSGEGYKTKADCLHAIELVQQKSCQAEIVGK